MTEFVKAESGDKLLYLVKLDKHTNDNKEIFMDATEVLKDAEAEDRQRGYEERGPSFVFELTKATEYANYVSGCSTAENFHLFNDARYTFFAGLE